MTRFGREIKISEVSVGDILVCASKKKTLKGKVTHLGVVGIWLDVGAGKDYPTYFQVFHKSDRIWRCEELRIVEVISISPIQKPFILYNHANALYLADPLHTPFYYVSTNHEYTLSFSSLTDATRYLQITKRAHEYEVHILKEA